MAKKKNPNALTPAQASAKKKEIKERRAARAQKAQNPKPKPAPGQLTGRGYDKRPGNNQTKAEKEATRGMVREMRGIARLIGGTPYGASTRNVRKQNEEGNFTHSTTKHFQDKEKAAQRSKEAAIKTRYTNMFAALSNGKKTDEEAQAEAGKIGQKRVTFKAGRKNAAGQYPEFRFGETKANGKSKGDASAQAVWRTARTMYDNKTKYEGAGAEGKKLIGGKLGVAVPEGMTYAKWTSKVGKAKAALTSSVRRKNLQQAAEPPKPASPKRTTEQVLYDSTQETASNGKGGNKSKWSSRHPIDAFARRENINEGESTSQGKRLRGSLKAGAEHGDKQAKRILGKPTISERERKENLTKTIKGAIRLSERRGAKFTPRNPEEQAIYDSIVKSRQTRDERGQRIQSARQADVQTKTTAKAQGRGYKKQELEANWGIFPKNEKGKHTNPNTGETATQAETKAREEDRKADLAKREEHKKARTRKAINIATNGRARNAQSTRAEREAALGSGKKKSKTTTQKKTSVPTSKKSVNEVSDTPSSKPAKGKVTVREVVPKEIGKSKAKIEHKTAEQVKDEGKLRTFVRSVLRSVPKTPYFLETVDADDIAGQAKKLGFTNSKAVRDMIARESVVEYARRVDSGEVKTPDALDVKFAKKDSKSLKKKKPNYMV